MKKIISASAAWLQRTLAARIAVSLIWMTLFAVVTTTVDPMTSVIAAQESGVEQISRLGEYTGYSEPLYSDWVRTSEYITVRHGTRIAIDVIRPAINGTPISTPLPVLYTHTRYLRAEFAPDGNIITQADGKGLPYAGLWLRYGYVLAASDLRGTGASFGSRPSEFLESDAEDAYDVIEWLGNQPWSNGNVGMYGNSYPGMTQWMAAGEAPPALKAIVPLMTYFDLYSSAYPGGVFQYSFISAWGQGADMIDKQLPPVPVDDDAESLLAAAAQQEHQSNSNFYDLTSAVPYRDSVSPITDQVFSQ
jgi:putative CocE/NonD family hydrolase